MSIANRCSASDDSSPRRWRISSDSRAHRRRTVPRRRVPLRPRDDLPGDRLAGGGLEPVALVAALDAARDHHPEPLLHRQLVGRALVEGVGRVHVERPAHVAVGVGGDERGALEGQLDDRLERPVEARTRVPLAKSLITTLSGACATGGGRGR